MPFLLHFKPSLGLHPVGLIVDILLWMTTKINSLTGSLQISPLPFQPSIAHYYMVGIWKLKSFPSFSYTAWFHMCPGLPQRCLPKRFAKWKWGGCHASHGTHSCRVLFLWNSIHSGPCLKPSLTSVERQVMGLLFGWGCMVLEQSTNFFYRGAGL